MSKHVSLSVSDGVATITLDRAAKRNALTRDMLLAVGKAADDLARDDDVRMLRLEADGPAFCAGMDLEEMATRSESADPRQEWMEDARMYRETLWSLLKLPFPTLAVVQGPAMAGGLGLVLACDLVLASEQAEFALPEPKVGITAAIVTPLLVHRLPVSAASLLLLSLQSVGADEARDLGLCQEVVKARQLKKRAGEWAESVLHGSRTALAMTKQFLLHCSAEKLRSQLESATSVSASARGTDDAVEGRAAFREKRDPAWSPGA